MVQGLSHDYLPTYCTSSDCLVYPRPAPVYEAHWCTFASCWRQLKLPYCWRLGMNTCIHVKLLGGSVWERAIVTSMYKYEDPFPCKNFYFFILTTFTYLLGKGRRRKKFISFIVDICKVSIPRHQFIIVLTFTIHSDSSTCFIRRLWCVCISLHVHDSDISVSQSDLNVILTMHIWLYVHLFTCTSVFQQAPS